MSEGPRVSICCLQEGRLMCGGAELLPELGPKWVDVQNPDEATMQLLAARYKLHKLAVEDCLHLDQRPKIEEYPDHQFIVLQTFSFPPAQPQHLSLHEMHFF